MKRLRRKVHFARFLMTKTDRQEYGNALLSSLDNTFRYFVMAYTVVSRKADYTDECIGHFAVFRAELELCFELGVIHFKKNKDDEGISKRSAEEIEMIAMVAKIDDEILRWKSSLKA